MVWTFTRFFVLRSRILSFYTKKSEKPQNETICIHYITASLMIIQIWWTKDWNERKFIGIRVMWFFSKIIAFGGFREVLNKGKIFDTHVSSVSYCKMHCSFINSLGSYLISKSSALKIDAVKFASKISVKK